MVTRALDDPTHTFCVLKSWIIIHGITQQPASVFLNDLSWQISHIPNRLAETWNGDFVTPLGVNEGCGGQGKAHSITCPMVLISPTFTYTCGRSICHRFQVFYPAHFRFCPSSHQRHLPVRPRYNYNYGSRSYCFVKRQLMTLEMV